MKKYKGFLFVLLAALLAAGLFHAGTVYAATDCFNDIGGLSTAFQEAICWMAENGITSGIGGGAYGPNGTVTRAQMALFMYRQAQVPPETGNILVTMGPDEWFQNRNSPSILTVNTYYTDTEFINSGTGTGYIIGIPDLPVSMYGRSLALSGMEFCYQASASVSLIQFDLYVDTQSSGVGTTFVNPATDDTDRTDSACRLYTFTPVALSGEEIVNVKIHANWTSAGASFYLGRATFVLTPTTTTVPPLSMPELGLDAPVMDVPAPRD